jgi:hypothetical protein
MVDSVHDLVAEYPPPEALRVWLLRLADFARVKHGLRDALQMAAGKNVADEADTPINEAVAVLFRPARRPARFVPGLKLRTFCS